MASFVDVPGHERFVRNMLAGAHGIDAVVLVVAADESVMPQTREHFHICRLLGIPRGLVALTKCDAADPDSQATAELEVRELVAGSFLEGRPVLRVSARSGLGLDALQDRIVIDSGASLDGSSAEVEEFAPVDQYQLQCDLAATAFRGEATQEFAIEDAIANMRVIDALYRSAVSGRWESP